MRLRFHQRYFLATVALFLVEVGIAVFIHDNFIRPYVGDVLVVGLIYSFVRTFADTKVIPTTLAVLAFAFAVEIAQWLRMIEHLGLEGNRVARIVLGTSFAWQDLLAYTIGAACIIILETTIRKQPAPATREV